MKKLILITVMVIGLFAVGVNYPTYTNSFSGETLTTIAGAGVAGCAANEAWKGMTNAPRDTRPVPTRSEVQADANAFEKCERRFPEKSQNENFFKCLEVLN